VLGQFGAAAKKHKDVFFPLAWVDHCREQ